MSLAFTGKVIQNKRVASSCYRLELSVSKPFSAKPGQFLQVEVNPQTTDPLLKRPFSIAGLQGKKITLFYRVRGKGTGILSRKTAGDTVTGLGPLGNPYPVLTSPRILAAGGMGFAGLLFLASRLVGDKETTTVLLGARTAGHMFACRDFTQLGLPVICATDDGSAGTRGLVTDLLAQEMKRSPEPGTVYTCGPMSMLRETVSVARKHGWRIYCAMEGMMACGFGVCRGCALPASKGGYLLACVDGPVFDADQLLW